jgi:cytochrome c
MKRIKSGLALACLAAVAAFPAAAQSTDELLKKHACVSCHKLDEKFVGPAFKTIAAKYRGQKDVESALADRVRKGSHGRWPEAKGVPMPPNPGVSDKDAQALVKWVLSQ